MSDSEEPYTVVDELEEGEIVENGSSIAAAGNSPRPKKQKTFRGTPVVVVNNSKPPVVLKKNKTSPIARKTGNVVNRKSSYVHKTHFPSSRVPSSGHLAPPSQSLEVQRKTSPKLKKPAAHEPKTRFSHQQTVKMRGRALDIPAAKDTSLRESEKGNLCTDSVPQLDLNSSYDDLLKHHREIQKALARLEQEQKKSRRKCPHKSGRKRSRSGKSRDRQNRSSPPPSGLPNRSSPRAPPAPKTKPKGRCRLHHARKGDQLSSLENKSCKEAPAHRSNRPDVQKDDELEQLRLNALLSVSSRPGSGRPPDGAAGPSGPDAGGDKENTVPNGGVGSSAFSVSGCRDDYSVMDMEVDEDEDDSCARPLIVVSVPRPPEPPQLIEDEEEDIEVMRERLLQSLRKAREPDSTTDSIGAGATGPNYLEPSNGLRPGSSLAAAPFSAPCLSSSCDPTPDSSGIVSVPSPMLVASDSSPHPEPCSSMPDNPVIESFSAQSNRRGSASAIAPLRNSRPGTFDVARSQSFAVGSQAVEPNSSAARAHAASSLPRIAARETAPEAPVVTSLPSQSSLLRTNPGCSGSNEAIRNVCHIPSKPIPKKACAKPLPPSWTFMKQKPVIINLDEDTTEESDSESSGEPEVPSLISLEELIRSEKMKSSCRQSDKTSSLAADPTPGPSTANAEQSLEGPSLVVAVAARGNKVREVCVSARAAIPFPVSEAGEESAAKEAPPDHGSKEPGVSEDVVREYNLLCKKLTLASDTFKKEQQILAMKKINANKKKSAFINSQLVVQRLKEQLAAAEKVKNTNMRMMFVANAELETVQGSVLKRALLVKQMREQCHRLEEQISSSVPFPLDVILNT